MLTISHFFSFRNLYNYHKGYNGFVRGYQSCGEQTSLGNINTHFSIPATIG